MKRVLSALFLIFAVYFSLATLTTSIWQPVSEDDLIRPATRPYEFDYTSWTIDALADKIGLLGAGFEHYLSAKQERIIITDYFQLVNDAQGLEKSVEAIYSDPAIKEPKKASASIQTKLTTTRNTLKSQSSLAEMVIQNQISTAVAEQHIAGLGQPIPPVLYHVTSLPKELVISPRSVIALTESISLDADTSLDAITTLEKKVEKETNKSALIVSIGGVGTYPTMVMETSSLSYLVETVAHEWVHNYLDIRPLGIHYLDSPEMRTMNETTASLAGDEIGQAVLQLFYKDLLIPTPQTMITYEAAFRDEFSPQTASASFNFQQEMYNTRLKVDQLLAQGKVEEAESYMEQRREFFLKNGYQIRKLNQAYFAFHGSYAAEAYSAAGEDPIGAAVRSLRVRSATLAEFLHVIGKITSPDQLYLRVNSY